jgi:FkbM family methyltransferase
MIPLSIRRRSAQLYFQTLNSLGIREQRRSLACGHRMCLETRDLLSQRLACEEAFEPAVRRAFCQLASRGGDVIDIGANIGYYTLLAASLVPEPSRVYAFEPQPRVMGNLRRNIDLNRLGNVTVFDFALSSQEGQSTFYLPVDGFEGHGSLAANGRFQVKGQVFVATRTLDAVLRDLHDPPVGLIKMDAEGAELSILKGAVKLLSCAGRPPIIFEANEENARAFGYSVFDLLSFVHGFGYNLHQLDHEDWLATTRENC